ncbi:MAG: hypothetical protein EU535_01790 [Promethearchaeota archaeon]|nr:MAG: hypothetical protein EU535_01790 [Candidatus Lokiarchaeota archaeon]
MIYYSPRIIFFKRFSSSNISSLSELNPPPGLAATEVAADPGGDPGAAGGPIPGAAGGAAPGALGGPGLLAKAGAFTPGGAEGGAPDPGAGGSLGAGGKLPPGFGGAPPDGGLGGSPPGGAFGGAPPDGGLGGPPPGGAFGGAPPGKLGGPLAAAVGVPEGASCAPVPLSNENKVLAAAVFALVVEVATMVEEVLTVCTSSSTVTPFKSFWAFCNESKNSLIPLTVFSSSSAKPDNPFLRKLITLFNFFCSFETTI